MHSSLPNLAGLLMEGVQSVQGTEYYVCTEGEDFNCIIVGYLVIEMNQQPTVSFFFPTFL